MLSDILFEAIQDIEYYQNEPVFQRIYGPMEEEINQVKEVMRRLQEKLDMPPGRLKPNE